MAVGRRGEDRAPLPSMNPPPPPPSVAALDYAEAD